MPQCDSIELIKKAKCGDEAAREKVIVNNMAEGWIPGVEHKAIL